MIKVPKADLIHQCDFGANVSSKKLQFSWVQIPAPDTGWTFICISLL